MCARDLLSGREHRSSIGCQTLIHFACRMSLENYYKKSADRSSSVPFGQPSTLKPTGMNAQKEGEGFKHNGKGDTTPGSINTYISIT